jgi:hypothetical protein
MKGESMSTWIWIIGGVITASLLIMIAQGSLFQLWEQTDRQNVVQDFRGLNSDIENICRQARGAQESKEANLNGVRAVFAVENRSEAPTESPIKVANSDTSLGQYVCMSFEDKHYGCVQHGCNINMTWMGQPLEGSDPYIIAEESGYTYDITVKKKNNGNVRVNGDIIP